MYIINSKSVLVYALHSLEYVLGLARFREFVPKLYYYIMCIICIYRHIFVCFCIYFYIFLFRNFFRIYPLKTFIIILRNFTICLFLHIYNFHNLHNLHIFFTYFCIYFYFTYFLVYSLQFLKTFCHIILRVTEFA